MKPTFTVVLLWISLIAGFILELSLTMIGIGIILIIFLHYIDKNG